MKWKKAKNHWNNRKKTSKSHRILFSKRYCMYGTCYEGRHHYSWKRGGGGGGGGGGGDDCANTMWQSICTWTPLIFVEAYPDISISICQVKVKSALLLNNTPLHQCRCETQKNLYDCLTKPFAINLYLKIFQIFNIMWGPNLFKRPDLILIRNKTIFE